jgi:hypothetical protein
MADVNALAHGIGGLVDGTKYQITRRFTAES